MTVRRSIGYRLAETRIGDTIQGIAARELGDAARWPELVSYNGLAAPYVVDSLSQLEDANSEAGLVILAGSHIKIPASRPHNAVSDPADIFGTDIRIDRDGFLDASETGDLAIIAGPPNLTQALNIRFATYLRELTWHQTYGNPLLDLVGRAADPVNLQLARAWGERTIRSDPRIDRVERIEADINADAVTVDALAVTTDGRPLPVGGEDA